MSSSTTSRSLGLIALITLPLLGLFALPLLALTLSTSGTSGGGLSDAVPAQYRAWVLKAGSICEGVTPAVIAAQIDAESAWNPTAGSWAGAQGISQFLPSTWAAVGVDGDGDGVADILNPADAILSQGHYMCGHLANVNAAIASGRLTGDPLSLALAAYNAGWGAVQAAGGVPHNGETEIYVQRILERMATYQAADVLPLPTGDLGKALAWAKSIADDKTNYYMLTGEGPKAWDCSGLSQATMRQVGIELPHKAHLQATDPRGQIIPSLDAAKPGDLLFWGSPSNYWHVAIYMGNNMMVSADSPEMGINYEEPWATPTLIKRFTN